MNAGANSIRLVATAVACVAAAALAGAAPAPAATTPGAQNAVSVTGASRNPPTGLGAVVDLAIEARSGPLGESPEGTVSFAVMINRITHPQPFPLSFSGPVTCLNVIGDFALVNFFDSGFGLPLTVELVDRGGDGADGFGLAYGNDETDCSSFPTGVLEFSFDQILGAGRAVVHDAAPATSLTHAPPASSARRKVRFAFTSSEPGSFQCRLDGEPFAPCESPRRYRRPERGRHVFRVRAIDAGANPDPSPEAYEFRIRPRA